MIKYTKTALILHWLIALLIIAAFILGIIVADMEGFSPTKIRTISWHKWIGITVLGLVCVRLLWRLFHQPPPYPFGMPRWQQQMASGVHILLYVLIFCVPISGYLLSMAAGVPVVYLGLFPLPVLMDPNQEWKLLLIEVHFTLNMVLLGGFGLHVLATLKHQFIDRDDILKRMLP